VERQDRIAEDPHDGVLPPGAVQPDGHEPDLPARTEKHPPPERVGEELGGQADPEDGNPLADRRQQEALLVAEEGVGVFSS